MDLIKMLVLFLFVVYTGTKAEAQNNRGFGGELAYNFQSEGLGLGVRYEVEYYRFSISPQVVYFPGFNDVHEFYIGISGHLNLFRYGQFRGYALGNLSFNGILDDDVRFRNYKDRDINFSNWAGDLGLGITTIWKWSPFLEARFNVNWEEVNVRIGFIHYFRTGEYSCQPYY